MGYHQRWTKRSNEEIEDHSLIREKEKKIKEQDIDAIIALKSSKSIKKIQVRRKVKKKIRRWPTSESSSKKAYVATWSDKEDSTDNEVAHLCFMALQECEVTSNSSNSNSYTFDELQDAYDELVFELKT
ncbi:hypothetical protein GQ457_01G023130 [Hibiscus cannabinus]